MKSAQEKKNQVIDHLEQAQLWANSSAIEKKDREQIQTLLKSQSPEDANLLRESFYKDLEFGTGGMRSIMGLGTNRMNKYNIQKATQALCNVVKKNNPQGKICISFDSRNFSQEFAREAACVIAGNNLTALIYKQMNPVALLSFSVRHLKAQAGVMVTASHNPPEYNGFKVFWADGAQVTPPNDQEIISSYELIKDLNTINYCSWDEGISSGKIKFMGEEIEKEYYSGISNYLINPEKSKTSGDQLKIVFTPIHGTGLIPCKRALEQAGFTNLSIVTKQAQPDGSFPTVTSPNPENPSALKMAVDLMKEQNADIVYGTDPDTDRLGVAVSHHNEIYYLTGNQIGSLMLNFILSQGTKPGPNSYIVKTIVSTPLLEKIAHKYDLKVYNCLTGFKWICAEINKIEQFSPEEHFVFATEESYGYLNHPLVRDKDAVSAIVLMSELALYYKQRDMSLIDALDEIYATYGFHQEDLLCLDYFGKEGAEKIQRIMKDFRSNESDSLFDQKIQIKQDFLLQTHHNYSLKQESKLSTPSSNVLGFTFESGDQLFLRPSGTEPKIKFYMMTSPQAANLQEAKEYAKKTFQLLKQKIKEKCDQV